MLALYSDFGECISKFSKLNQLCFTDEDKKLKWAAQVHAASATAQNSPENCLENSFVYLIFTLEVFKQ